MHSFIIDAHFYFVNIICNDRRHGVATGNHGTEGEADRAVEVEVPVESEHKMA